MGSRLQLCRTTFGGQGFFSALSIFRSPERRLNDAPCGPITALVGEPHAISTRISPGDDRKLLARPRPIVEVSMMMSEYEERFRPLAPFLHQTFAAARGQNEARRRRRIWVTATAIGLLVIAGRVASHHAVHGWTSGHRGTATVQGQRSPTIVLDEFRVFLCGTPASGARPTAGDPDTPAVYLATTRPVHNVGSQTPPRTLSD